MLVEYLDMMLFIQNRFDKQLSDELFTDLSDHIFEKWLQSEYNILNFISRLDVVNKQIICDWCEKNYKL
jgi:hypothetical protein